MRETEDLENKLARGIPPLFAHTKCPSKVCAHLFAVFAR